MITDLERIGDQTEDIEEIVMHLHGCRAAEHTHLKEMAAATIKMVTDSVDAYVKQDTALVQAVLGQDDAVDAAILTVKRQLIDLISAALVGGEAVLNLLMIAKYLERIGDHATNLAEWVIYAATDTRKTEEAGF